MPTLEIELTEEELADLGANSAEEAEPIIRERLGFSAFVEEDPPACPEAGI